MSRCSKCGGFAFVGHECQMDPTPSELATVAIQTFEKRAGVVYDVATTITCPRCEVTNGLKFYRTTSQLWAGCSTPGCVTKFRNEARPGRV